MPIGLRNIFLTLAAFVYYPIRGNARKQVSGKNFLVINQTENIGDMVCTTPVFHAIKQKEPDARVVVLGVEKNRIMMEGNKDIDTYIVIRKSVWSDIRQIRRLKIDVGIIINPGTVDFALLFLGGVKTISCPDLSGKYKEIQSRTYSLLAMLGYRLPYVPGKYVPRQYIGLLRPFNLESEDIRKHLAYTSEADTKVKESLQSCGIPPEQKLVAIAPGAGTKIKQWPSDRFGEVANYLSKKYGVGIVIIGGPRDIPEIEIMKRALDVNVQYCNFADQTLDELKATLSKVVLIIGNDSGSVYIAESFGAGTMVLVGPTDEAEHPLQDRTHRVVIAKNRGSALLKSHVNSEDCIDTELARKQIESITIEQVLSEIDDIFREMQIEVVS